MNLGKRIEAERKRRKWTQVQLCAMVDGLNQQALDRLEKRDSRSSAFALGIAKAFGMRLEELMAGHMDGATTTPAADKATLAQALPVVLRALACGLSDYRAGQIVQALQAATKPGAPLGDIERDLLAWLNPPEVEPVKHRDAA